MVLAFGIILGSILAETGAAQVIAERLLRVFGMKRANWAILITGFVVGVAMFYNAGYRDPGAIGIYRSRFFRQSLVPLALSMAAPLSVTHGFLPPRPVLPLWPICSALIWAGHFYWVLSLPFQPSLRRVSFSRNY